MIFHASKPVIVTFISLFTITLYFSQDLIKNQLSKAPITFHRSSQNSTSQNNSSIAKSEAEGHVYHSSLEGGPRVRQASMFFGNKHDNMYERGLKTHITYGDRWGYPTDFLRQDILSDAEDSSPMYDKLLYLLSLMITEILKPDGRRAEWIAWFDADTVILNHNVPWALFLPPSDFSDIHLLMSSDMNGFNAGVFLIRVNAWSINLLTEATALPLLKPDLRLDFAEQTALSWVSNQSDYVEHKVFQPRRWWNAYGDEGEFQVHFPGLPGDHREAAMGGWLDRLETTPEDLRSPLKYTPYPVAVKEFWSNLRGARDLKRKGEECQRELEAMKKSGKLELDWRLVESLDTAVSDLRAKINEQPAGMGNMEGDGMEGQRKRLEGPKQKLEDALAAIKKAKKLAEEGEQDKQNEADGKVEEGKWVGVEKPAEEVRGGGDDKTEEDKKAEGEQWRREMDAQKEQREKDARNRKEEYGLELNELNDYD